MTSPRPRQTRRAPQPERIFRRKPVVDQHYWQIQLSLQAGDKADELNSAI